MGITAQSPVVVVGSGPVGPAAAARLLERGLERLVLEEIALRIRTGVRATAVSRKGVDVMRALGRGAHPPLVRTVTGGGEVHDVEARPAIDASGTWGCANPLGRSGLSASGETEATDRVTGPLPDVLGSEHSRFAGRHTVVVGAGHSVVNTLLSLVQLAAGGGDTRITWAVRGTSVHRVYGGGEAYGLPARGALGTRLKEAVESGSVTPVHEFAITGVTATCIRLRAGTRTLDADTVVAATGLRPDLDMLR
ncbi:FAD-dependent monooxygenase [Streptomyces sulphureus]|uniref:FAD-dependent monooxygenase n=1 Tax=Streptomyces sulphureus TaxID=47758 RepID=UPI00035F15BF|nr:FAD-dependent monooxygenase [Streptomyces sulphureus]